MNVLSSQKDYLKRDANMINPCVNKKVVTLSQNEIKLIDPIWNISIDILDYDYSILVI